MPRLPLLALLASAVALAQQSTGGILHGLVVDDRTGAPIPGATIGAGPITGLRTTAVAASNAEGKFRFTPLNAGRYWIECSKEGYVKLAGYTLDGPAAEVPAAGEARPVTVRLVPGASIAGTLLSDTGQPIAGAAVEADRSGLAASVTDRHGRFRLLGLPAGEYRLMASFSDLVRRDSVRVDPQTNRRAGLPAVVFYPDAPDPARGASVKVGLGVHLDGFVFRVSLQPLVTVSGIVVDARTGTPLEGGMIELRGADGMPGPNPIPRRPLPQGAFRFDLLTVGSYQLLIYRRPGPDAAPFIHRLEAVSADIGDLKLSLPAGGRLTGKIIGPRTPGMASIRFMPSGSFVSSGTDIAPDGAFAIDGLAPGKWTIGFMGRPSDTHVTVLSIRQSGRPVFQIDVADGDNPPIEIETAEAFWVTGAVTGATGAPVENATVVFENAVRLLHQSRKDGVYRIALPAGDYKVSVWRTMPAPGPLPACPTAIPVRVTREVAGLNLVLCP